jgi:hypothetical protein
MINFARGVRFFNKLLKFILMKTMVTDIKVRGDKEIEQIPSIEDKALRINLNENIYGTFAEIGAGQETVRHFFRAGGSSGTIAKATSAYDKDFSDVIYGIEADGRYVTESRLKKMLSHELNLIEKRLSRAKHPHKMFFSYANTVATIDFAKQCDICSYRNTNNSIHSNNEYKEEEL